MEKSDKMELLKAAKFIILSVFLVFVLPWIIVENPIYEHMVKAPREAAIQRAKVQIPQEFKSLNVLNGANLIDSKESEFRSRNFGVEIEVRYKVDEEWNDIRTFYMNEATTKGWRYKEEKTYDNGASYIEFRKEYDKGHFKLNIYKEKNVPIFKIRLAWYYYG